MLRYAVRLSVSVATFLIGLSLSAIPSLLPSDVTPGSSTFEQEVLEANQAYLEAHVNRDVAALDRLLAEEFNIGGRYGRITSKRQRLAMLAHPNFSFLSFESSGTRVTASGGAGEVSGQAVLRGSYMGREFTSPPYRYTRRFEKRDGRWQLVGVEVFRAGW